MSNASILANQSHTKVMWMEDDPLNAKEYLKKIQSDQLKTPFIRMLDKQEKIVTAVNSTVAPFLHSNVTRWLQGVVDNHLGEFVSAISPSIYCSFGSCKVSLEDFKGEWWLHCLIFYPCRMVCRCTRISCQLPAGMFYMGWMLCGPCQYG